MTPYERLVIALRHGVLVRGKATMRYAADVVHQSVWPQSDDRFCVVPVEAGNAIEAARKVAEIAAARRYEKAGTVGYVGGADGWYLAAIGEQKRSHDGIALHGLTVSIHVWAVD
jgi:hypothetical protein